jgi:hypothetical protein
MPGRSTCPGSPVTTMRLSRPSRVSTIFICGNRRVLRLIDNDERVLQCAPAHEGDRGDLDLAARHAALHLFLAHQFAQAVPDGQHVGVDLLFQRAGQEAELLPCFHRRARHDQALARAGHQFGHAGRNGQEGLARAGRADAENEAIVRIGQQIDVARLTLGLRRDRLLQPFQAAAETLLPGWTPPRQPHQGPCR